MKKKKEEDIIGPTKAEIKQLKAEHEAEVDAYIEAEIAEQAAPPNGFTEEEWAAAQKESE